MKYDIKPMFTSMKNGEMYGSAWNTYNEAQKECIDNKFDNVSVGFVVVDNTGTDMFPEDDLFESIEEAEAMMNGLE